MTKYRITVAAEIEARNLESAQTKKQALVEKLERAGVEWYEVHLKGEGRKS